MKGREGVEIDFSEACVEVGEAIKSTASMVVIGINCPDLFHMLAPRSEWTVWFDAGHEEDKIFTMDSDAPGSVRNLAYVCHAMPPDMSAVAMFDMDSLQPQEKELLTHGVGVFSVGLSEAMPTDNATAMPRLYVGGMHEVNPEFVQHLIEAHSASDEVHEEYQRRLDARADLFEKKQKAGLN